MKKLCLVILCFIVTVSSGACGRVSNHKIIIGNSTSNHANGGLFCMTDDAMIIYSQLNEYGKVYMAELDGSGRKLLFEDSAYNLNCIGDEVYYQKMSDSTVWRYDVAEMQSE